MFKAQKISQTCWVCLPKNGWVVFPKPMHLYVVELFYVRCLKKPIREFLKIPDKYGKSDD